MGDVCYLCVEGVVSLVGTSLLFDGLLLYCVRTSSSYRASEASLTPIADNSELNKKITETCLALISKLCLLSSCNNVMFLILSLLSNTEDLKLFLLLGV